ncbi:hypothetical protein D082_12490 [Synechocystis sp. PCC 6714]|nr:hypothetical protein D082_12490 [Synechocystis sp. PCC 6714]
MRPGHRTVKQQLEEEITSVMLGTGPFSYSGYCGKYAPIFPLPIAKNNHD